MVALREDALDIAMGLWREVLITKDGVTHLAGKMKDATAVKKGLEAADLYIRWMLSHM